MNHLPILAMADADHIQDYVFATQELRLIRGASSIQVSCANELAAQQRQRGARVLRHDGGTVVALLPADGAHDFKEAANGIYRRRAHSPTVTAVWGEHTPGEFRDNYRELQSRLEQRKSAQSGVRMNGGSPYWAVCDACAQLPAANYRASERLCQACLLRDRRANSAKQDRRLTGPHQVPSDFEWLGQQSKPENYIAIVYLDCDRLGKYVSDNLTDDPWSLRILSTSVESAVRRSVHDALGGIPPVVDGGHEIDPYLILLMGGDDAYVALPADRAFEFVANVQRAFSEQRFANGAGTLPRPTFSVGIAIAHSHYPIGELVRVATDLLRSAKNIEIPEKPDSLDYAIITASMTGDTTDRFMGRTCRPYPIVDFALLRDEIAALKAAVPANKLKRLYQIAHESPLQGDLEYLDLLRRLQPCGRLWLLKTVGQSLWDVGRTRAADVAELLEFC